MTTPQDSIFLAVIDSISPLMTYKNEEDSRKKQVSNYNTRFATDDQKNCENSREKGQFWRKMAKISQKRKKLLCNSLSAQTHNKLSGQLKWQIKTMTFYSRLEFMKFAP